MIVFSLLLSGLKLSAITTLGTPTCFKILFKMSQVAIACWCHCNIIERLAMLYPLIIY